MRVVTFDGMASVERPGVKFSCNRVDIVCDASLDVNLNSTKVLE